MYCSRQCTTHKFNSSPSTTLIKFMDHHHLHPWALHIIIMAILFNLQGQRFLHPRRIVCLLLPISTILRRWSPPPPIQILLLHSYNNPPPQGNILPILPLLHLVINYLNQLINFSTFFLSLFYLVFSIYM